MIEGVFMKILGILLLGALISFMAQAEIPVQECSDYAKNLTSFRIHRFLDSQEKCWLSVNPIKTNNMVYRSYVLTTEGTFLVFNSIDPENHGVTDGARTYMIFPRNQLPTVMDFPDYDLLVTPTKGIEIYLSKTEPRIIGMKGGHITEDPKVNPYNKGGLEFKNVQALLLDGGWRNFGDPFGLPNRKSTFTDKNGNSCQVTNKEIFKYDSDGDTIFRFTDKELRDFLKVKCPKLVFNPFEE